jgi:hypothetical protein
VLLLSVQPPLCSAAAHPLALSLQATRAYKRKTEFDGFADLQAYPPAPRDAAWLLSTAGMGGDDYYDEYDDYEDAQPVPDEWDSMDPKYVNGRRVLLNRQIE